MNHLVSSSIGENTVTFTPLMDRYLQIKAEYPTKPKRGFAAWYKWLKDPKNKSTAGTLNAASSCGHKTQFVDGACFLSLVSFQKESNCRPHRASRVSQPKKP